MTWHSGSWHSVLPQNPSFPGNSRLESSSPFVPQASVLTTCSPLSVSSLTLHCGVSVLYPLLWRYRYLLPTPHYLHHGPFHNNTVTSRFDGEKTLFYLFHWCSITLLCSYWPKLSSNIFVTNHRHWCGRPDNSSHNNFPISCCFHKLHLGWINKSSRISFKKVFHQWQCCVWIWILEIMKPHIFCNHLTLARNNCTQRYKVSIAYLDF